MRTNALFFSFLFIFVATALVTLLGVIGVLSIDAGNLRLLLGAFLLELAVPVVAIYRKMDFSELKKSESQLKASIGPRSVGTELGDYREAVDKINELIDPTRERLSFKFLAITGRSITSFFLTDLIKTYKGDLDIELQVVDPANPHSDVMPKHWAGEVTATVQELFEEWNARKARKYPGTLKVWKYKYLPCIVGDIINDEHLLLTFFGWDHQTKRLGNFQEQYVYHPRSPKTRNVFKLYQSWFDHAPKLPWETATAQVGDSSK